jgi:hypothetical protein
MVKDRRAFERRSGFDGCRRSEARSALSGTLERDGLAFEVRLELAI